MPDDINKRITIDPEQCGGRPCIRSMSIRVSDVLDLLATGRTAEQVIGGAARSGARGRASGPALRSPPDRSSRPCRVTFWIDARLSPHLAPWTEATFGVEVHSVKRLGLRDAKDREIFDAARAAEAVVMTKDQDFVALQARLELSLERLRRSSG